MAHYTIGSKLHVDTLQAFSFLFSPPLGQRAGSEPGRDQVPDGPGAGPNRFRDRVDGADGAPGFQRAVAVPRSGRGSVEPNGPVHQRGDPVRGQDRRHGQPAPNQRRPAPRCGGLHRDR